MSMSLMACAPPAALEASRVDRLIPVIRGEFAEMPGMRLTRAQFERLWSLTALEGERILDRLLGTGFLVEGRDGLIRRSADSCC
jgi:hypothetical protein